MSLRENFMIKLIKLLKINLYNYCMKNKMSNDIIHKI